MTSHARGPDNSLSAARITAYSGVAATLIGAIATIITVVVNHDNGNGVSTGPGPPITPVSNGLRFSPIINGKLTVSGSAQKDVNGMYVLIGPKPRGGYDTGCGNVVNQRWQAEVSTDLSWQKYQLQTVPSYDGSCPATDGATSASAFKFTFQGTEPTTPPPPPAGQILDCAAQFGPSCFTGPGFGPPSVYPPKQ